jgi:methylated-DNA-[protein]-cysteine S-methyltransferase
VDILRWDEIDTPFGPFSFAVLDDAVVAAAYGTAADHVDSWSRAVRVVAAVEPGGPATSAIRAALDRYLADPPAELDVPLDLRLARGFQREVLETLLGVPAGETVSYGELAQMAGRPGAARAVGGAMARNPVPLFVPCHRVLAAGGRIGGFGGARDALDIKRWLLAHEHIPI